VSQATVGWRRDLGEKLIESGTAGIENPEKKFSGFPRVLYGDTPEFVMKRLSRLQ
jgi:hypothetical protein